MAQRLRWVSRNENALPNVPKGGIQNGKSRDTIYLYTIGQMLTSKVYESFLTGIYVTSTVYIYIYNAN